MSSPRAGSTPALVAAGLVAAGLAPAAAGFSLSGADVPAPTTVLAPEDAVLLAAIQDEAAEVASEEDRIWSFRVNAGGSASFGNTDKQDAFATFTGSREDEDDKTEFRLAYFYGASDGDRTDNEFEASIRQDWFITGTKWEYFAQAKFEYDEFQSWEYRASGFVGFGYQFEKREDFELLGRAGLGGSQEFNSPNDDWRWEAVLGLDLRWDVTDRTEFTASTEIFPSLSDFGEFRTLSRAGVSTLLDEELNMSFTAAVEHEYQSENEDPTDKNDFRVLVGLQFEF